VFLLVVFIGFLVRTIEGCVSFGWVIFQGGKVWQERISGNRSFQVRLPVERPPEAREFSLAANVYRCAGPHLRANDRICRSTASRHIVAPIKLRNG